MLLLLAILMIAGASSSRAQVSSAQITGVITDPSGAALSNASALIVSKDTGATRQVQSNQSGEFNAPALGR
ncbi:MAG TPA: carboxypeptidase-like regulatory domain-containing protein [Edaphobacter sp.]|nr:carboxypeptidase-like regulatory domain-containing protein [Edaphobacter sp.]